MGGRRTGRRTSCRNDGERDEEIESIFFEEQLNGSMGRRRRCEAKDDVERRLRLRGAAGRMTNPSISAQNSYLASRKVCVHGTMGGIRQYSAILYEFATTLNTSRSR